LARLEDLGGGVGGGIDDRCLLGVETRGGIATFTALKRRCGRLLLALGRGDHLGRRLRRLVALGHVVVDTGYRFDGRISVGFHRVGCGISIDGV
jgi:hypothetical protein